MIPQFQDRQCTPAFCCVTPLKCGIFGGLHQFGHIMRHPTAERICRVIESEFGDESLSEFED